MSEFLAEALVVVKPDTSKFRTQLEAELRAIKVAPIAIPIVAAGAGIAAAATATAGLVTAQKTAQATVLGLASSEKVLSSRYAEQAVVLSKLTADTLRQAGAQETLDLANKNTGKGLLGAGTAAGKLDAALLGLRTAVGSSAVIGLSAVALGAIAAGKAIRSMIVSTAQFEVQLNTFRVVTGATASEMAAVSEAAKRLGQDVRLPAVTAGDAAIAMTELAKAGLTVEDALAGAEGVLQLATAAQISNADAAKIAANALNSFALAGDQATRVADVLANAANAAQGSISDFGLALQQSESVAKQVGLSLEDTTAILSLFAKNGLQGSDAGTALRVALIKLTAPTDKAKEALAELSKRGFELRDAFGNVRADVFAQFGEATRNLTPAARDATAALIFGQDAIRAVSIGAREGADGLRLMQFEIDQTGTASEVAAARTEGFSGAIQGLGSSLDTLAITFGGPVNRTLTAFARGATTATDGINKLTKALGDLFADAANPPDKARDFFGDISQFSQDAIAPITRLRDRFRGSIDVIESGGLSAAQKLRVMNKELANLEKARIAASQPGSAQRGIADQLTKEIQSLRAEIDALEKTGKGISNSVSAPLRESLEILKKVRAQRISLDVDTTGIDRLIASLKEQIPITDFVEGNINRLRDDFDDLGNSAKAGASAIDVLAQALRGLSRESTILDDALLKLQSEGGTPQQQIGVLQQSISKQNSIIAAAQSKGNQAGDASAIRRARAKKIADQKEIESIQAGLVSDAKDAAAKAKKFRDEQDEQVKKQLEAATTPISRLLDRAAGTASFKDDIKFTTQLIVLYKHQIEQATKRIKDVDTRNAVLKVLGDKLFAAILSRKKLAQDERKRIHDALVDKFDRIQTGTQLDIELADINENTKRRISLREKLIQQLKNERKKLHLTGNALKENRNEIARINAEIEEIRKEEKKTSNQFAQLSFEFLQRQQGFAANLLGNLIPGGATGGLVGGTSPASQSAINVPGLGVTQESHIAQAKDAGFSAGQGNTTNSILRKILHNLEILNGHSSHPEARNQRVQHSGSANYTAM